MQARFTIFENFAEIHWDDESVSNITLNGIFAKLDIFDGFVIFPRVNVFCSLFHGDLL